MSVIALRCDAGRLPLADESVHPAGGGAWGRQKPGRHRYDRDLFGETRPLGPKRRMSVAVGSGA